MSFVKRNNDWNIFMNNFSLSSIAIHLNELKEKFDCVNMNEEISKEMNRMEETGEIDFNDAIHVSINEFGTKRQ